MVLALSTKARVSVKENKDSKPFLENAKSKGWGKPGLESRVRSKSADSAGGEEAEGDVRP